jgi:hypothetical protein
LRISFALMVPPICGMSARNPKYCSDPGRRPNESRPLARRVAPSRLRENESVSERIKELQGIVAEKVIDAEIRRRNWRVQVLQQRAEKMLALSEARTRMYADEVGESRLFEVAHRAQEIEAVAMGCRVAYVPPDPLRPEYPKTMVQRSPPTTIFSSISIAPGGCEGFRRRITDAAKACRDVQRRGSESPTQRNRH